MPAPVVQLLQSMLGLGGNASANTKTDTSTSYDTADTDGASNFEASLEAAITSDMKAEPDSATVTATMATTPTETPNNTPEADTPDTIDTTVDSGTDTDNASLPDGEDTSLAFDPVETAKLTLTATLPSTMPPQVTAGNTTDDTPEHHWPLVDRLCATSLPKCGVSATMPTKDLPTEAIITTEQPTEIVSTTTIDSDISNSAIAELPTLAESDSHMTLVVNNEENADATTNIDTDINPLPSESTPSIALDDVAAGTTTQATEAAITTGLTAAPLIDSAQASAAQSQGTEVEAPQQRTQHPLPTVKPALIANPTEKTRVDSQLSFADNAVDNDLPTTPLPKKLDLPPQKALTQADSVPTDSAIAEPTSETPPPTTPAKENNATPPVLKNLAELSNANTLQSVVVQHNVKPPEKKLDAPKTPIAPTAETTETDASTTPINILPEAAADKAAARVETRRAARVSKHQSAATPLTPAAAPALASEAKVTINTASTNNSDASSTPSDTSAPDALAVPEAVVAAPNTDTTATAVPTSVQGINGVTGPAASRGSISPQAVTQQVIDGTVNGAMEGQSKITLTLNPSELGTIRVQLTQRGNSAEGTGQIHARMIVSTPEAQQLLTKQMAQLQEKLGDQNIRLENLQVLVADSTNGTQATQEQAFNANQQQHGQGQHPDSEHPSQQQQQHGQHRNPQQRQQLAEQFDAALTQSEQHANLGQIPEKSLKQHPPAKGGATPPRSATTRSEGERRTSAQPLTLWA